MRARVLVALIGLAFAAPAYSQAFRGAPLPQRGGISVVLSPGYDMNTLAYFTAMTVQPDSARKALLATLVKCEKAWGAFDKLDWLTIEAAHDAQAARVNMVAPAKVLSVLPTSLSFTVDRGYSGDGGTNYLSYNEPLAAGGHYTANSATLGFWWNGAFPTSGVTFMGTASYSNNSGAVSSTTSASFRVNGATPLAASTLTTDHDVSGSRGDASTLTVYSGSPGATLTAKASSSNNAADSTVTSNIGSLLKFSGTGTNGRIAAAWSGAGLSLAELQAHHVCLGNYLTAIGAQ